jgi:tripartite-type tricarboxylate transporter receptor subunit TctC
MMDCGTYPRSKGLGLTRRHLLSLAAASGCTGAVAQAWPVKPIRLVVPFPPGGGTDIVARETSQRVAATTGWTFVIENKPGADGNLGVDAVAKSAADGNIIVLGQTSNLAINPTLCAKLP